MNQMTEIDDFTFKVRVKPKSGEALTSFLMRMADLNGCEVTDIRREVSLGNERSKSHIKFSRFDYDLQVFDRDRLATLLGLSIDELNEITAMKFYSKFFSDPLSDYETAATMLRDVVCTSKRKVCPKCIKEEKALKLVWQVNEIEVCPIHGLKLKSECTGCNRPFHYSDDILVTSTCTNHDCNADLLDGCETVQNNDFFEQQMGFFKEWSHLLYYNAPLAEERPGLTREQSLALKLLYVAQGQRNMFSRKEVSFLSLPIVKNLLALVRNNKKVKRVRVQDLLFVLRSSGLSLAEFLEINVPSEYLTSVLEKYEIVPPSNCLAPWCCGKKNAMHLCKDKIESRNQEEKVRYTYYYTCTSCFMRYGCHPVTGVWQEIHRQIDLVLDILRMASEGETRCQIASKLKKNIFYVSEVFGYLAFHKLLPEGISKAYIIDPREIPADLLGCFQNIDCHWRTYPEHRYRMLKERYGWSLVTYSYYYANYEVQKYFMLKPSNLRKPLKKYKMLKQQVEQKVTELVFSETQISMEQVAATLDISEHALRNHGLVEVVREHQERQLTLHLDKEERYLRQSFDNEFMKRREIEADFPLKDVYPVLGRCRDFVVLRYPGLFNYIQRILLEYRKYHSVQRESKRKHEIRLVIKETHSIYNKVNVSLVARRLGISYIHVAGYKRLKSMITEEIELFLTEG